MDFSLSEEQLSAQELARQILEDHTGVDRLAEIEAQEARFDRELWQALASAGDDKAYIRAIQDAGYATDPEYADKVIGILDGALLRQTLAAIDSGVSSYG